MGRRLAQWRAGEVGGPLRHRVSSIIPLISGLVWGLICGRCLWKPENGAVFVLSAAGALIVLALIARWAHGPDTSSPMQPKISVRAAFVWFLVGVLFAFYVWLQNQRR